MKVNKKSSSDNLRDNKKPKKSRKSINKEIKRKRKRVDLNFYFVHFILFRYIFFRINIYKGAL